MSEEIQRPDVWEEIAGRGRVSNVDLSGAAMPRANAAGIRADHLTLQNADVREANFSGAVLRMCALDNSRAGKACFDDARLEDSTAVAADFSGATFRHAHLTETSFSRAVLHGTNFEGAEGDGIDFRGADLNQASLKDVRFDEADFRGADLRGADLSHGRFHSADFRGSLLEGANFDQADASGAMFDHGEGPPPAAPGEGRVDSAAIGMLNEFLALLPAAVSGAQPAETMNRVQELIEKMAGSAGYSDEQRQTVHDYLSDLAKPGGFDLERLQKIIAALNSDSDEPPEDLKSWLEPLMRSVQKDRKI